MTFFWRQNLFEPNCNSSQLLSNVVANSISIVLVPHLLQITSESVVAECVDDWVDAEADETQ